MAKGRRKKPAKAAAAKKESPGAAPGAKKGRGKLVINVVKSITDIAGSIHTTISKRKRPALQFPQRSLANVSYTPEIGFFELGKKVVERTLTVNTVKTFAQTLRMMSLSKELVDTDDMATKREAYYVSKNWGDARFDEQPESDTVMEDVEALFRVNREQLGFIPEEKGGEVAGKLVVLDKDRGTGKTLRINCTKFGSGAYSIPISVEHLQFETDARFILAIETAGMFQRLVKHNYWKKAQCILVSMGGVPTRACRRFIRRLSDEKKLPVYVFVDCDPYGIANIYRTLKVGSGNAAHVNEFFCVPQAKFLGITPKDIVKYKLPTHPLKAVDVKRADDAIKNDPFFNHHKEWKDAIKLLLEMNVRAEQQALAKHGLNYVIEKYLPYKIRHVQDFLP